MNAPGTELSFKYEERANLHRPRDPSALAGEIRRLHGLCLRPRDIASALRLDLRIVLDALVASP